MMKKTISLTIILMCSILTAAQSAASIHGHVTDERNANIRGAEVRLRSRAGAELVTFSDGNGNYSFKSVGPGDYVIEIAAQGFATFSSKELSLSSGQAINTDVQLSVRSVSENVVVTATGTAQRVDETSKAITVVDNQ